VLCYVISVRMRYPVEQKTHRVSDLNVMVCTGFVWHCTDTGGALCEHRSESQSYIQFGKFLD
jgi:hypothetical protein